MSLGPLTSPREGLAPQSRHSEASVGVQLWPLPEPDRRASGVKFRKKSVFKNAALFKDN